MKTDVNTKEPDVRVLLTPDNAAIALDCSRSKIYNLMRTKAIRWVQLGSDRRIPMSEIERLAAGKPRPAEDL